MGEMEEGVRNGEDKTEISSNQGLQVSVSFGRFENDSLSWEKFSAFSPNKYLEEVEKCATPGSVAQKKAYFEAHYKKIAERKAELMDQEKQKTTFRSIVENQGDSDGENGDSLVESNDQYTYEEDKHVTDITTELNESCIHKLIEDTVIVKECQTSDHVMKEESKLEKPEEVVLMEEKKPEEIKEIPSKDSDNMNDTLTKEITKEKDDNLTKMNRTRGSPKTNPVKKKPIESKIVTNRKTPSSKEAIKKTVSSLPKAQRSKPASTFTSMATSHSSVKKEKVSTLPRNKQTMTLSRGLSGSDPTALAPTRKSLIMERMGDKDIVKRAFKTFQKNFNQSKSLIDGQSPVSVPRQVPSKVSPLTTASKENGSRSARTGSLNKKTYGLKNDKTAEKTKERIQLSKITREKTPLQGKSKERVTEAKIRRHSPLHPKSKSIQGSLVGPILSKGSSDKVKSFSSKEFCPEAS